MDKFTKTNAEKYIRTSSDAQVAQLGHLNKIIEDLTPKYKSYSSLISQVGANPAKIIELENTLGVPVSFFSYTVGLQYYYEIQFNLAIKDYVANLNMDGYDLFIPGGIDTESSSSSAVPVIDFSTNVLKGYITVFRNYYNASTTNLAIQCLNTSNTLVNLSTLLGPNDKFCLEFKLYK